MTGAGGASPQLASAPRMRAAPPASRRAAVRPGWVPPVAARGHASGGAAPAPAPVPAPVPMQKINKNAVLALLSLSSLLFLLFQLAYYRSYLAHKVTPCLWASAACRQPHALPSFLQKKTDF